MQSAILKSTLWSLFQRYLPSVLQILATLIITRKITPSDFGEVALVTTFYQISILLVSSGLGDGLIYKCQCSSKLLSSVFYFNIFVALILYAIFYLTSSNIASFYGIVRLSLLMKIIGVNILIYSISFVQRVILQKQLRFKFLAITSLLSTLFGSILGICLAYHGYGVWSIVFMTLSVNFIESIIIWLKTAWYPSLLFSWFEVTSILGFSIKILFNNIIQVIYDNIFSLVIGKSLGSRSLGLFNRMQTVAYFTTTNFMYSLESVFFPILCKDKNNSVYLYDSYARLLRLSSLFATFVLVLLFVISKELVILVLSETWSDGIPVLKYVLLAFLFVPISYINNSFLKIFNKTQALLCGNIIKKIIGILILCLSVPTKDLKIICYGFIFYYALDSMISMIICKYIIKINLVLQMKYLLCNYITAVVCICIGSYIPTFNIPIFDLVIKTVFVIVFYAVIQFGFKPVEFKEIRNIYHNFQYNKS